MSLIERDESVYDWDMLLNMNDRQLHLYLPKCRQTIEQVRQFIKGSQAVDFECQSKEEKYSWMQSLNR